MKAVRTNTTNNFNVARHSGNLPFKGNKNTIICKQCYRTFSSGSNLTKHFDTKQHGYKCSDCTKRFPSRRRRLQHYLNSHNSEKASALINKKQQKPKKITLAQRQRQRRRPSENETKPKPLSFIATLCNINTFDNSETAFKILSWIFWLIILFIIYLYGDNLKRWIILQSG